MATSVSKLLLAAKIVQKAVLEKQNKILLIRRSYSDDSFAGWWDLPGGNVDKNENLIFSLARELREETKLKVKPSLLRAFHMWVPSKKYVLIGYTTKNFAGTVKLSHEHPEYKWVTLQQALKMKIQPIIRRLLRAYARIL